MEVPKTFTMVVTQCFVSASDDEIAVRRAESESFASFASWYGWISSLDVDKDGSYDTNLEMNWYFSPIYGHMLLLELLYMDIELSDYCEWDVLEVVR